MVLWDEVFTRVAADNPDVETESVLVDAMSANLNPERRFPSMFEPVHGSAPDIAGRGVSNPIGAIASAALMLDHFGLHEEARSVETAIETANGRGARTRDIGGSADTDQVNDAIVAGALAPALTTA